MTLGQLIINLLLGFLAFFVTRYIGSLVAPDGADKDKIINIIGIIVGVIVFFANFAAQIIGK